jgi:formate dehydrogenase subunit gamma
MVRELRNAMKRDTESDLETVRNLVAQVVPAEPDALLPLLHDVQARLGHIPKAAIQMIATALNLSRADVHGVVTFYHDFHEEPTAEHVVQFCMAEACQAVGCRSLAAHAQETLGVGFHDATPDGRIQVESAYCFGNCAAGPTVRIDDRVYGRVTNTSFDALMQPLRGKGGEA